jgi:cytochrome b subunit of formate dehydrogenase
LTDIFLAYGGIQMEWFSQLIGTLKLFVSTRIIIAIFLTSGFLLFFDKYFSFLEEIIKNYESYIAILFIFTGILIIVDIVISIIHYVSKNLTSYDLEKWKIKRRIKSLNNHEKAILRIFYTRK